MNKNYTYPLRLPRDLRARIDQRRLDEAKGDLARVETLKDFILSALESRLKKPIKK